jgi:exodeoxyribonuclease VII small subunit
MTTPSTPDPGAAGPDLSAGETTYADAQAELDAILRELDGDEVDVDVLGARVRRAAELLRLCRDRIAAARFEVEQVVGELEAEVDAAVADDLDEAGAEGDDLDEEATRDDDGLDDEGEHDEDDAELAGWSAGDEP